MERSREEEEEVGRECVCVREGATATLQERWREFRSRLVSSLPVLSFIHSPAPPRLDKLPCRVIEKKKER